MSYNTYVIAESNRSDFSGWYALTLIALTVPFVVLVLVVLRWMVGLLGELRWRLLKNRKY